MTDNGASARSSDSGQSPRPAYHPARFVAKVLAVLLAFALVPIQPVHAHEAGAQLMVSSAVDRTGAASLSGASLSGQAYIFLGDPEDVTTVEFWLDNPEMTGAPRQLEGLAPFDFMGGSTSAAVAFNTDNLSRGPHVISARVTHSDGHVSVVQTNFTAGSSTTWLASSIFVGSTQNA